MAECPLGHDEHIRQAGDFCSYGGPGKTGEREIRKVHAVTGP